MPNNHKNKLTIGIRVFYKEPYQYLSEHAETYLNFLRSLNPHAIVGVTIKDDPFTKILKDKCDNVSFLEKGEYGFARPMEELYKMAKDDYLLTISIGVDISDWQLQHAFTLMQNRDLYTVGWRISTQENDGSYLGKLSYNTALLYRPNINEIVKEVGGIPKYVENGALGNLQFNIEGYSRNIPVGGQEDLAVQLRIFKHFNNKQHKLFCHIKHYVLEKIGETGLNLTSKEKLLRKILVAELYRNMENVDPTSFLDCWDII